MKKFFIKFQIFDKYIEKYTSYALVTSVLLMLVLSIFAIILRWFNITYRWGEPLVRHLVFLSTFLGGVIATGRGVHISIDIIQKYLEGDEYVKFKRFIGYVITTVSIFTLGWLIYASSHLVFIELEYGKVTLLGIHSGFLIAIIPMGFFLILMRCFCLLFKVGDNC